MHTTNDLEDGYLGSGSKLLQSVKIYGKDQHVREIVEYLPDVKSLQKREREIVTEALIQDPICLNMKIGGNGGWSHWHGTERHLLAARYGRQKAGKKVAKAKVGIHSDDYENSSNFGINETFRKVCADKARTPEALAKRKATMAANGHGRGEQNSQFGTCWITNGVLNKKIKRIDLNQFLEEGWTLGRTMGR